MPQIATGTKGASLHAGVGRGADFGTGSIATQVTFEENELILVNGERSRSFYLLSSGSVVVELRGAQYVIAVQASDRVRSSAGARCSMNKTLCSRCARVRIRPRWRSKARRCALNA